MNWRICLLALKALANSSPRQRLGFKRPDYTTEPGKGSRKRIWSIIEESIRERERLRHLCCLPRRLLALRFRRFGFECRLGCCKARNRDTIRRAAYVIHSDLVTERD
jgi:hypothetical protein